jgi:hypothetical protein
LEHCNISKDIPERKEVEKRFDELLLENASGKIGDVVGQCIRDIQQHISLPSCGMEEEARVEAYQLPPISPVR